MDERGVRAISDLTAVAGSGKHQDCTKAILHQVDEAETSVFRVQPGGRIEAHSHSEVWDLFIGIEGTVEISYDEPQGTRRMTLKPKAFLAIPPNVRHEVRNPAPHTEAVFVLIHAPYRGYDHIPAAAS